VNVIACASKVDSGTTPPEAAETALGPAALVATTLKVYVVPAVSPVTVLWVEFPSVVSPVQNPQLGEGTIV
jgi:hypothetical protein